ncbi:MAG: molecular chaperone TorD family protein [Thermodesulfobacteriota bacterium]
MTDKASTNASLARERAELYGFFAALCLKPVTPEFVTMLVNGSILGQLNASPDSQGAQEMALFVREAQSSDDLANELTAEHARLFALPADVVPHEAFYTDPKKRLGGHVTAAVALFYEKAGAQILSQCIEMPDHLGIELQLMEFLCSLEAQLFRNGDTQRLHRCRDLQKQFLEEHLLRWAFDCCERLVKFSKIRFYKAVALLLTEFLEEERGALTHSGVSVTEAEQAYAV